jgi:transposase
VTSAESLSRRFELLGPHLTERQRRLWLAVEAQERGRDGIREVAQAAGVAPETVRRGVAELEHPALPSAAARRRPGAGRKRAETHEPGLLVALDALIDPDIRGQPDPPLRWTSLSTRALAAALQARGYEVSDFVVRRLLKQAGYRLRGNARTASGRRGGDRGAQFAYLNEQARDYLATGCPVVSVDTSKREAAPDPRSGQPAGARSGRPAYREWAEVDTDQHTTAFAVATLRRWWHAAGRSAYSDTDRLLVASTNGGFAGYGATVWNQEMRSLAAETGLRILVCPLPPGTSKWHRIENQFRSHLTMDVHSRPLICHEVIVEAVAPMLDAAHFLGWHRRPGH